MFCPPISCFQKVAGSNLLADSRVNRLSTLTVDDIFHAETADGIPLICLVVSVSEADIEVRTVTSQISLVFDRQTGVTSWGQDVCRIDSVEALPGEIHDVLLALDEKYQQDQRFKRSASNDLKQISDCPRLKRERCCSRSRFMKITDSSQLSVGDRQLITHWPPAPWRWITGGVPDAGSSLALIGGGFVEAQDDTAQCIPHPSPPTRH
jgi:hypothetical protein